MNFYRNRYQRFIVWMLFSSCIALADPTAEERAKGALVGAFVPGVEKAELERGYEDRLQQEIPFGLRSYYLAPWKAYMDTWPARRMLDTLGCCINGADENSIDAVAQLLAEAGIRRARFECGWGGFEYGDPSRMQKPQERNLRVSLEALKKHGIRPMILLNAHHGWPCPVKQMQVKLLRDAPVGQREIYLDQTGGVMTGRTGLRDRASTKPFP